MRILLPTRRTGRLRGSRRASPAAGVLVAAVAFSLSGCGTSVPSATGRPATPVSTSSASPSASEAPLPTDTAIASSPTSAASADAAGLVVLADGSAPSLRLIAADGTTTPLPSPDGTIRFVTGTSTGLLAVTGTGSVAVGRLRGSSLTWTVDARFEAAAAAAVDPPNTMIAVIDRRALEETRRLRIRIAPIPDGPVQVISVDGLSANGPPGWLADGRLTLRAATPSGASVLALVDPASGDTQTVALDALDVAVSSDGATVALVGERDVRIVPTDRIGTAGAGAIVDLGEADPGLQLAAVALDRAGQRVALLLEDEDQQPVSIRVATARNGWRADDDVDVPAGAAGVWLAWPG
jgi:hypothetical protein